MGVGGQCFSAWLALREMQTISLVCLGGNSSRKTFDACSVTVCVCTIVRFAGGGYHCCAHSANFSNKQLVF